MNLLLGLLFLLVAIFIFFVDRIQFELIEGKPPGREDVELLFAIALVQAFVVFVMMKFAGWLE